MERYLAEFLDLGCSNLEYLRALSRWPRDDVDEFLEKIASKAGNDKRMTEMDIMVLRKSIYQFFKTHTVR